MISYRLRFLIIFSSIMASGCFCAAQDSSRTPVTMDDRPDTLLEHCIRWYSEGSYQKVIDSLSPVSDSVSAPRNYYIGLSFLAVNNYENAIVHLKRSVRIDSTNTSRRFQLARALYQYGALKESRDEYETIVCLDPEYFPAAFQLGLLLYEQRLLDEAAGIFRQTIALNPRDFLSYYYLGMCYLAREKNDSARAHLSACVTLNPNHIAALTALASLYYTEGNYSEALRLYQNGLVVRPDLPDLHFKSALCYQHLNNHQEAIVSFHKAIRQDSLNGVLWGQLGFSCFKTQDLDQAVTAYRTALEIDKDNPLYYYNLALALEKMDSTEQSAAMFHRTIAAYHPENIANTYIQLGTLYFFKKQLRNALTAYRHALDYQPGNKFAQYYMALTYDQLKDPVNAARQYQKFLSLAHDDSAQMENTQQARHRLQILKRK